MLQIKNISKQYKTGDLIQNALNGVSLNFRDNEFVSILGPSGSGKTTLLNIVGGLDRYDSGDLIINNISTQKYKDRDWDSYRNHTIGFVFQSYNLIPHQTVLANVELALTIGGISKKERKKRALLALEEVGLRQQAHKRPNQMSGGQMQRVAIARALVNNPDILLADEPTGALDTETSVQVMELLKEVARDRLVIMVTHNPELAQEYSTRIVKLKDGKIIDDSDPFLPEEEKLIAPEHRNLGKASMSVFTAMALSFQNLLTKKGRTLLTAFAGSIGIIGIALILSLSNGFQNYIDKIQEDTLTSYPLTVTSETADTMSILLSMASQSDEEQNGDVVKEKQYISDMFSTVGTNDLTALKQYLEENEKQVGEMVSLVRYQYSVSPLIYTTNTSGELTQVNPSTMMSSMLGTSSTLSVSASVFNEMMDDEDTLKEQYDILAGSWPENFDEALIVLPEPNGIPDVLVYGLGLRPYSELKEMMSKILAGEKVEKSDDALEFTYEDFLNLTFKVIHPTDTYKYNETYGVYEDMTGDTSFMQEVYDNSLSLKIVGVVCAKDGATSTNLSTGVAYTKGLTEYVIGHASESEMVKKQLADEEVDVISGKRFDDESDESGLDFQDMISIDTDLLSSAFGVQISESDISNVTQGYMGEISAAITADSSQAKALFLENLKTFVTGMMSEYAKEHSSILLGNMAQVKAGETESIVSAYMEKDSVKASLGTMESLYLVPQDTFSSIYSELLKGAWQGYLAYWSALNAGEDGNTDQTALINEDTVKAYGEVFMAQDAVTETAQTMAQVMTEAVMQKTILSKVGALSSALMSTMASSFQVDESKIAEAFQFDLSEEELTRLMQTMTSGSSQKNASTNLISLGYQDLDAPSSISFYFKDFDSKEAFISFLDEYNEKMEKEDDTKVIQYTDLTGILMSSVKTIVDSVSYVLIAFVSISLIVSSIMIGIITYISVLERTKEIGVLRAIGASKRNISSIFNAETFIIGLCAGLLGIFITLLLLLPINSIIHNLTGNQNITATLPVTAGAILTMLSVILTLIGGLIPSKQAAKKDPVLALRSE